MSFSSSLSPASTSSHPANPFELSDLRPSEADKLRETFFKNYNNTKLELEAEIERHNGLHTIGQNTETLYLKMQRIEAALQIATLYTLLDENDKSSPNNKKGREWFKKTQKQLEDLMGQTQSKKTKELIRLFLMVTHAELGSTYPDENASTILQHYQYSMEYLAALEAEGFSWGKSEKEYAGNTLHQIALEYKENNRYAEANKILDLVPQSRKYHSHLEYNELAELHETLGHEAFEQSQFEIMYSRYEVTLKIFEEEIRRIINKNERYTVDAKLLAKTIKQIDTNMLAVDPKKNDKQSTLEILACIRSIITLYIKTLDYAPCEEKLKWNRKAENYKLRYEKLERKMNPGNKQTHKHPSKIITTSLENMDASSEENNTPPPRLSSPPKNKKNKENKNPDSQKEKGYIQLTQHDLDFLSQSIQEIQTSYKTLLAHPKLAETGREKQRELNQKKQNTITTLEADWKILLAEFKDPKLDHEKFHLKLEGIQTRIDGLKSYIPNEIKSLDNAAAKDAKRIANIKSSKNSNRIEGTRDDSQSDDKEDEDLSASIPVAGLFTIPCPGISLPVYGDPKSIGIQTKGPSIESKHSSSSPATPMKPATSSPVSTNAIQQKRSESAFSETQKRTTSPKIASPAATPKNVTPSNAQSRIRRTTPSPQSAEHDAMAKEILNHMLYPLPNGRQPSVMNMRATNNSIRVLSPLSPVQSMTPSVTPPPHSMQQNRSAHWRPITPSPLSMTPKAAANSSGTAAIRVLLQDSASTTPSPSRAISTPVSFTPSPAAHEKKDNGANESKVNTPERMEEKSGAQPAIEDSLESVFTKKKQFLFHNGYTETLLFPNQHSPSAADGMVQLILQKSYSSQ